MRRKKIIRNIIVHCIRVYMVHECLKGVHFTIILYLKYLKNDLNVLKMSDIRMLYESIVMNLELKVCNIINDNFMIGNLFLLKRFLKQFLGQYIQTFLKTSLYCLEKTKEGKR